MSQETNITLGQTFGKEQSEPSVSSASTDYRWVKCVSCEGEIGVPPGWEGDTADCPRCGTQVRVNGWLQYRPPAEEIRVPAVAPPARSIHLLQPAPSIELQRLSDQGMICGILCVFFGWTVLIPLYSLFQFAEVSQQAKKEGVLVPTRATLGLILTLVFGGMQSLALIIHLNK